MDPVTAGLIMGGGKIVGGALQGLFGGSETEMTDEQKQWYNYLQQELNRNPAWLYNAYQRLADQAGATVRNWGASNLPPGVASGNILGGEMQARARAFEPYGQALGQYRQGIMGQISSLLGGQRKVSGGVPWYEMISGAGSDTAGGFIQQGEQGEMEEFMRLYAKYFPSNK